MKAIHILSKCNWNREECDDAIDEIELLYSKIKILESQLEVLKVFTHNPQTTVLRITTNSIETDVLNKE